MNINPKDISPDIISAAKDNPVIRQHIELYLHSWTGDPNTIEMSWQKTLESIVLALNRQVKDYAEVVKMHGVIKRNPDVLLLKDALVNEEGTVLQKIGAALRWARLRKKLSIIQLAVLRRKPRSDHSISLIERGKQDFNISTLLDIAKALNLKISIAAISEDETKEEAEETVLGSTV